MLYDCAVIILVLSSLRRATFLSQARILTVKRRGKAAAAATLIIRIYTICEGGMSATRSLYLHGEGGDKRSMARHAVLHGKRER